MNRYGILDFDALRNLGNQLSEIDEALVPQRAVAAEIARQAALPQYFPGT